VRRWDPPPDLEPLLVPVRASPGRTDATGSPDGAASTTEELLARELNELPRCDVPRNQQLGKQTNSLTPWQRRFAHSIGTSLTRGKPLTAKQAPHAQEILEEARRRGLLDQG
jgi:hypothetical protein